MRSGSIENNRPAGNQEQIQVVARRGGESLNPEPPDYKTRAELFNAGLRKPRVWIQIRKLKK